MKTTIKKLIKLGLNENDIKKELEIDDKKFEKLKERGTPLKVDNVVDLLEKYNATPQEKETVLYDSSDYTFCKKFDDINNSLGLDILDIPSKDKADIFRNIPNFVESIRKEVGIKKIQELKEQIDKVNQQIEELKLQYNLVDDASNKEEVEHKEYEDKCYEFIWKYDIKPNCPTDNLGKEKISTRVSREMYDELNENDIIYIRESNKSKVFKYALEEKKESFAKSGKICARYLRLKLI